MWAYNVTNPYEFLNLGATAQIHETGFYVHGLQLRRGNISFDNNIVTFHQFAEFSFDESKSCASCSSASDEVYVFNTAYTALLAQAFNEARLILSAMCAPNQIPSQLNINDPECAQLQRGNSSVKCQCCTALTCPTVLRTSPIAGRFSYLSMLDSGVQSSIPFNPATFPLASKHYSGMLRKLSVSELLTGSVSAFSGALSYARASKADQDYMSVVTNDMREVCEPLFCPNIAGILEKYKSANLTFLTNYLKTVSCPGRVPAYEDLIPRLAKHNVTLSEARAKELRYLQGVNCLPYTATFVTAIYKKRFNLTGACHDASLSPPCCMAQVGPIPQSQTPVPMSGYGSGCLRFVDGYMIKRSVYDTQEAQKYLNSKFSMHTNCATESKRMVQILDRGNSKYLRWITPSTGPNMVWADPSTLAAQLSNPKNGSSAIIQFDQDARFMFAAKALKLKDSFWLEPESIVDYSDVEDKNLVLASTTGSVRPLKYEGKVKVGSLESLRYVTDFSNLTSDETSIRNGELPYRNMFNQYFQTNGRPLIISMPNFYGVTDLIWNQSDNSKRNSLSGQGVNIYRLADGYSSDSKLLSSPELMTGSNMKQFEDEFKEIMDYATVTGNAVSFQAPSMISGYTLNCNPAFDRTCSLAPSDASNLCYQSRSQPCSAANFFTPRLQGEKIVPIIWFRIEGDVSEPDMAALANITSVLFALSVVIIVFTITFGLLLLAWLVSRVLAKPRIHHDDEKVVG
jgi:hypothetical protein